MLAIVLLPAGLLGDRFGRKKLLIAALFVFGAASAACAFSGSSGTLIASRAVLALGAGFVMILAIAMVPVLFDDDERRTAIGVVSTANFVGIPLGPIIGGWLLDNFWWGSVFLINVPLIAIALFIVAFGIPETRSADRPPVDLAGIEHRAPDLLEQGPLGIVRRRSIRRFPSNAFVVRRPSFGDYAGLEIFAVKNPVRPPPVVGPTARHGPKRLRL